MLIHVAYNDAYSYMAYNTALCIATMLPLNEHDITKATPS